MRGQLTKSKLERRLQKLETELTDASGMVPHTRKWLLYWTERIGKYLTGEYKPAGKFMTLEAFRAVMKACDAGEVDSPYARIVNAQDEDDEKADAA